MLKYLFVLLPGFSLFDLFFQSDVAVTDNLPATVQAGEPAIVEYQINKGAHTGFAKLQLEIPFGFTVKAIETKGASFSFSGQIAKFIWMTLPTDGNLKVKMELIASASVIGSHEVKGQFSYISDNQRIDYNLSPRSILVEARSAAPVAANSAGSPTFSVLQENSNCYREVTELEIGRYLVKITMKGLTLKGYAKLEEKMTCKATLTSRKNAGAVVTLDADYIKFVWFDAPQSGEFSVEYEISAPAGALAINGKLGYIKDNAPAEMTVGSTPSYILMLAAAQAGLSMAAFTDGSVAPGNRNTPESTAEVSVVEPTEKIADVPLTESSAQEKTEPVAEPEKTEKSADIAKPSPISKAPVPETGISYKVQIVAGHKVVGPDYFASKHSFREGFGIENHEGWVKYTTGKFDMYSLARDAREVIRSKYNFNGPFVTAYNNGERITVQEALMVSNQQWVK